VLRFEEQLTLGRRNSFVSIVALAARLTVFVICSNVAISSSQLGNSRSFDTFLKRFRECYVHFRNNESGEDVEQANTELT
jgi:hypothetical protein